MRVTTALLHQHGIDQMQRQQQALLRTQTQLSTQQRLLTAADAPADWAAGMGVEQLLAQSARWQSNAQTAQHRLALTENALAEGIDVLARVRELAIQANSAAQSPQSRAVIAQELNSLREQLLAIANRDDGQGRHLFAGSRDAAAPFDVAGGAVQYHGDDTVRTLQIGGTRQLADGDSGRSVFMALYSGDGTYAVAAGSGNRGAIHVQQLAIDDASLLDGGSYTVAFSAGQYAVTDAAGNAVASGAYAAGDTLRVRGVALRFSGTPADGDRFTLAPSAPQDAFALIDKLARLVAAPQTHDGARGQVQTGLQQALMEVDAAQTHFSALRAGAGLRLGAAEDALNTLDAARVEAQGALSKLRDVDIAEAAGRLQQQLMALEAAQASFVRVQGLSLFDYLR